MKIGELAAGSDTGVETIRYYGRWPVRGPCSRRRARNSGRWFTRTDSPVQCAGCRPNMMMAMPARLTVTPIQSVVVGRMPSTAHNQRMATPM